MYLAGVKVGYEFAEWKLVRVNIGYYVEVDGHYYSVPYSLVKQQLEVRLSTQVVEIFHKGNRVARHQRSPQGAPQHGGRTGRVTDLHFTVSYQQSKLITIDKQPDDDVMHLG